MKLFIMDQTYKTIVEHLINDKHQSLYNIKTSSSDISTMTVDFPRTAFVSLNQSAKQLFDKTTEMSNLTSYYIQGNYDVREFTGQILRQIITFLVKDDKAEEAQELTNKHHQVTLHYENDEGKDSALNLSYISIDPPLWMIAHAEDLSQAPETRPYTLLVSTEINDKISSELPDFADFVVINPLDQLSIAEQKELTPAQIFEFLQPKLKSRLVAHLIQNIFETDNPIPAIKALKKRLPYGEENLDHRDKKIEELKAFLTEFAPARLDDYERQFQTNFDFFKPEIYLLRLRALKLTLDDSDELEKAYQKLLMSHMKFALEDEQLKDLSFCIDLIKDSPEEFEASFIEFLKSQIDKFNPTISFDNYFKIYQSYLKIYPVIFERPELDTEAKLSEIKLMLQTHLETKLKDFQETLVQDLRSDPDYWKSRQSFILEKRSEWELLKKYHTPLEYPIDETIDAQVNAQFLRLEECQDILKADLESCQELDSIRSGIEAQQRSTTDFFKLDNYPQQLTNIFAIIKSGNPSLDLSNIEYKLFKRVKDIEIRNKNKASSKNSKLEKFYDLYFQSENADNYLEKITNFLNTEITAFKKELVLSSIALRDDEIDIAKAEWTQRETSITRSKQKLEVFQSTLQTYQKLAKDYLPGNLTIQTLFGNKLEETRVAFNTFKQDSLKHQTAYRQFIQEKGIEQALDMQIKAWENMLDKTDDHHGLIQLKSKIKNIYQNLLNANQDLSHGDKNTLESHQEEFKVFTEKLEKKIQTKTPPSFLARTAKRWQEFDYQQELLLVSTAIIAVAICNPFVVSGAIALGVAAISIALILYAALRLSAQLIAKEAVRHQF